MPLFLLLVHLVSAGPVWHVPYRLAATNHILLRAKLNGSGPYNFIMDTGAPALFVAEDVAKKLGIKPNAQHWGVVNRLEVEGGPVVEKIGARVEGPFQLQTMNQLALTGVQIHGVIGYNVLARFRIEIDATRPTLAWTPLAFVPPAPVNITSAEKKRLAQPVKDQKQMEAMAKMAAAMFAKKPVEVVPRGFLGIEIGETADGVVVRSVLPGGPAAASGLKSGDMVTSVTSPGKAAVSIRSSVFLLEQLRGLAPDEQVAVDVRRGGETRHFSITAGRGGL